MTARGLHVLVFTLALEALIPAWALGLLVPPGRLHVLVLARGLDVLVPPRRLDVLAPAGSRHSLVVDHRSQSRELPHSDHHAEHHRCHFPHHVLLSGPLHTSGPLHSFRRDSRQEGARRDSSFHFRNRLFSRYFSINKGKRRYVACRSRVGLELFDYENECES